jgi:hypothetical protein
MEVLEFNTHQNSTFHQLLAKIPINPITLKLALLQKYKYVGRYIIERYVIGRYIIRRVQDNDNIYISQPKALPNSHNIIRIRISQGMPSKDFF